MEEAQVTTQRSTVHSLAAPQSCQPTLHRAPDKNSDFISDASQTDTRNQIETARGLANQPIYEVLLVDCGADKAVKSATLERRQNLLNNGYCLILGLRESIQTFPPSKLRD